MLKAVMISLATTGLVFCLFKIGARKMANNRYYKSWISTTGVDK